MNYELALSKEVSRLIKIMSKETTMEPKEFVEALILRYALEVAKDGK